MLYNVIALMVFIALSTASVTHALGAWLFILVTHGILVLYLGEAAVHFPLYCGLAISAVVLLRRQWQGVPGKYLAVTLAFIVMLSTATLLGLNLEHSTATTINYLKGILLALLLAGCLKSDTDIETITKYCLTGLIAGSILSLYQHYTGQYAVDSLYVKRAAGLRGDPNDTAMLLVTGIPLSLYWQFKSKNPVIKTLLLGSTLLILFSIMLTGSRGGLVTLVIIALGFYFRRPTVKNTTLMIFAIIFMVATATDTFVERIETLVSGQEKHGGHSMSNRKELQISGIKIFLNNPILGVGPGNFGQAFMDMQHLHYKSVRDDDFSHAFGVAHNMHLEVFVETGLIGGILFETIMLFALSGFRHYDKQHKNTDTPYNIGFILTLSLSGLLIAGLFLSQGRNSVLWFIVGMGFAIQKVLDRTTLNNTTT